MARATTTKPRSGGRTKIAETPRPPAAKPSAAVLASKDELRTRVEKLERANATLRLKNKTLQMAHVEASEQLDALTLKLESLERRVEKQVRPEAPKAVKARATTPAGRSAAKAPRQAQGQNGKEIVAEA